MQDYSTLAAPLHRLLSPYKPPKRIDWTLELEVAYQKLLEAVHQCPKLFFMDGESPVFLDTDASDYGIGAYLYQLCNEKQYPIAFLSKSFDDRMSNWDVRQKEGFAIFYALDKWDYLLRDRYFIIRTDHFNLNKLKEDYSSNKKVQRWLTAMQHYDFDLQELRGVDNVVADGLSRLCVNRIVSVGAADSIRVASYKVTTSDENHNHFLQVHNENVGHKGVAETIRRLHANNIRWHGMNKDIDSFVKLCPCCQKNDQHFNKNVAIPFTVHGLRPFEKVDIDFIVGLTPDSEGITTIMVVIDAFTRWVNLYGLKEWNAEESASSLVRHIGQYGSPKMITSDKDPVLLGQIVKQTLKITGIKHIHTVAGSKQEQGIVERANKEVMRHLRNFIFDKSVIKSYSKYIPLV